MKKFIVAIFAVLAFTVNVAYAGGIIYEQHADGIHVIEVLEDGSRILIQIL